MNTLDMALRLSRRFPVFPCSANKRPACERGFLSASKDASNITALWQASPGPLIGVPTGACSGIDVLDIDPRHGGDAWLSEANDSLPVTRRHSTQSGGIHILFRHKAGVRNTASKIAPGVDTRGEGGYIIYWPAACLPVENPRHLDDWPAWLLKILFPPKTIRAKPFVPANRIEADARAALMIARAYQRVRNAAPGQRHYELRAAAATLGGLLRFFQNSPETIQSDLIRLIMETGAEDEKNALKTAEWAMRKGSMNPLLA